MDFTIERSELLDALDLADTVVDERGTIPILKAALIESAFTDDEVRGISVTATDQEVGVRRLCKATVATRGKLCTPTHKLRALLKAFTGDEVRIRTGDKDHMGHVEVSTGRSRFRLLALDPMEFPSTASGAGCNGAQGLRASANTFAEMIESTQFAMSKEESRANLCGIFLDCKQAGQLRMVATNGHRLATVMRPVEGGGGESVILPRKGVGALTKLLNGGGAESVDIAIAGGVAHASRGPVQVWMRLVEGGFPDYTQVVPKPGAVAGIDRAALRAALRRVAVVSSDKTHGVRLKFDAANLELSAINPDVGEGTEELEIQYDGEPVEVGFSADYLLDVLAVLPSDGRIQFGLGEIAAISPGVIRHESDETYSYVLMPMRF